VHQQFLSALSASSSRRKLAHSDPGWSTALTFFELRATTKWKGKRVVEEAGEAIDGFGIIVETTTSENYYRDLITSFVST
jgi:hypothetical protein